MHCPMHELGCSSAVQRFSTLALWDRRGAVAAAAAEGPPALPSAHEVLPCTAMPATRPLARICRLGA